MQPIDVSLARSFKAFLRDWLSRNNQADRREDHFLRLGLSLAGASQAQLTRARIVFSVIDAAHQAATLGLATAPFRLCGLFLPCHPAPVLASRYVRASEEDPEMEERVANPGRIHAGSHVLTSPEFLSRLVAAGWVAQHEIDIAGVVPEDGDFVNETVPEAVLRNTMVVEDGEPTM
jgi:hypothetical protein